MNYKVVLYSFLIMLLIASCTSTKPSTIYLGDLDPETGYPIKPREEALVRKDDRLKITVGAKNPELALPFNLQGGGRIQVDERGAVTEAPNRNTQTPKGYLVDNNGNIDFPVLGPVHVEGLTMLQTKDLIRDKIIKGNYINDPFVTVDFANFKVVVLGEVNRKGILNVDEDRITLLEALVLSGDITEKGRPDKVAVIREVNGKREIYMHDIRSKTTFDSPTFYLQQNDIVYVEPKPIKQERGKEIFRYGTVALSTILAVASLIFLFK